MSGTHTEAVLNKLAKPELIQLLLKAEATLASQIADLSKEVKDTVTHLKKIEADISIVRIVSNRLTERNVKTESQYWENAQYSQWDTLEIVGIPNSVDNSVLEEMVHSGFKNIAVEIEEWDVPSCHCLKEKKRTIVKYVNRKDCLQILRVKNLNSLIWQSWIFPRTPKFLWKKVCLYYNIIIIIIYYSL